MCPAGIRCTIYCDINLIVVMHQVGIVMRGEVVRATGEARADFIDITIC